jgi:ribonuclease PH
MALDSLRKRGLCGKGVLREEVAAVSIGLFEGSSLLDLCYEEDRDAQVDLNLVATASGNIVEVQGTAEGAPMTRAEHDALLALGLSGVTRLIEAQKGAIDRLGIDLSRLLA